MPAESHNEPGQTSTSSKDDVSLPRLAARGVFGGTLMGLANLVPGISGGTMLLAAGVYTRFISAVAEVTTLRFRRASLVVLGSIGLAMVAAIGLGAGPVKDLVLNHRWIMYSAFIGLTLGGAPVVWRLIGRMSRTVVVSALAGFAVMSVLAWYQITTVPGAVGGGGFVIMLLAGAAAGGAMILPGVSGGYLLLVLGAYIPILAGIDEFVAALRASDAGAATEPFVHIILPVGIGVAAGIVGISNILKWLLDRFRQPTLGVLLGFLLGAVVGLWPFQEGMAPEVGATFAGQAVASGESGGLMLMPSGRSLDPEDFPIEFFGPSGVQIATAIMVVLAGFALTWLIARWSSEPGPQEE